MHTAVAGLLALAPTFAPPQQGGTPTSTEETIRAALLGGRAHAAFRYRLETVEGDGSDRTAVASTLRTVLGYETGTLRGFRAYLEFEDVAQAWDDTYDSTRNGKTRFPVVADPTGAEVNQAYVAWDGPADLGLRMGRQEIVLDNARFVGNVGWRQNHQSFDALLASYAGVEHLSLTAGYIHGVQTITGASLEARSYLVNAAYDVARVGRVIAYYYHLDIEDAPLASVGTVGVRVAGSVDLGSETRARGLRYTAEVADQRDVGDNPTSVDQGYLLLELAADLGPVDVLVGRELLGGSGDTNDKFRTPLATGHAFNGYADQFVVVPDTGLEDVYLGLGALIGTLDCRATYHWFDADAGGLAYGTELDLTLSVPVGRHARLGLKLADFQRDDEAAGFVDTRKAMLWMTYGLP